MNNFDEMCQKLMSGQTLVVDLELSGNGPADQNKIDLCKSKLKAANFVVESEKDFSGKTEAGIAHSKTMIYARKI